MWPTATSTCTTEGQLKKIGTKSSQSLKKNWRTNRALSLFFQLSLPRTSWRSCLSVSLCHVYSIDWIDSSWNGWSFLPNYKNLMCEFFSFQCPNGSNLQERSTESSPTQISSSFWHRTWDSPDARWKSLPRKIIDFIFLILSSNLSLINPFVLITSYFFPFWPSSF